MTDRNPQRNAPDGLVKGGDRLPQPRTLLDALIVGVLAAVVSLGGAGRPSFWYDEAATISASYSRSLHQLWQMLANVDVVEGLYYLLMHGWFDVFPPTEFWSRAPSGLAIGGAAAGVVVLSKHFVSRNAAVASGVVCAILPRATWAGIEARPYALSMMAAVWLTVLLVYATCRATAWLWLSYGTVLTLSVLLDVYLVLLFFAHVAFICVFQRRQSVRTGFAVTSAVACCIMTPFIVTGIGQAHQISWISPIGHQTIEDVTIQQYFDRNPPFALLSALVVAAAIALWLRASAQLTDSGRQLLVLAIARPISTISNG